MESEQCYDLNNLANKKYRYALRKRYAYRKRLGFYNCNCLSQNSEYILFILVKNHGSLYPYQIN